jgi:Transglutaminase-like superfamily
VREREEVQEVLRRRVTKLIPLAIIVFWLAMMALFVKREFLVPYLNPGPRTGAMYRDVPTDNWMGVFDAAGGQIGYLRVQTWPDSHGQEPGNRLALDAAIRMTFLGTPTEVEITGSAWTTIERGLEDFNFQIGSGSHDLRIAGTVKEGMLEARIHTGGEIIPLQWPLKGEVMLWSGMGASSLNMPALKPGQEFLVDTFDPMTLSVGRAHITCIGEETLEVSGEPVETKVVTVRVGEMTTKAWLDSDGETVRAEMPLGFVLQKITQKKALNEFSAGDAASLMNASAIRPSGKALHRGARRMTVKLSGLAENTQPPEDDTQKATGTHEYSITVPRPTELSGSMAPDSDESLEAFLGADPFVQTTHPKITALAAEIVGDESDPWQRAVAVHDWVYANIDKVAVLSVPSALDVLETREGDCNENTVLFTALARAAGVPTRIAIGVVWSEAHEAFYYHAWPEVYVGQWVWMDPTFGQPVADATHVKLLTGDISQWSKLLAYLGRMNIEVLDTE